MAQPKIIQSKLARANDSNTIANHQDSGCIDYNVYKFVYDDSANALSFVYDF
jgi:hypothetical protein